MSAALVTPSAPNGAPQTDTGDQKPSGVKNYRAFVGGVGSGVAKLTVGHPFDTIKVRLQTSSHSQFSGPLDCLVKTVRNEGLLGVYKGASPPLVGWMFMDSIMLGSMAYYRRVLNEQVFNKHDSHAADPAALNISANTTPPRNKLPLLGHVIAGVLAGWTVSFVAAPVEHVKARLQVQYAAEKSKRLYSGPIDCAKQLISNHGIKGLYHGLGSTLIFRTFFAFWWGSYELFTRAFTKHTQLSTPAINFWAGGLSAQVFWLTSYPSDVVKQRIMTDSLGPDRKFPRWRDAARAVYRERGWKGYWRGFVPCFLRAFPANAAALTVYEAIMRWLP